MPIVRDPLEPKLSMWHFLAFCLRASSALARVVGDRRVMRAQLEHVLALMDLPQISVRADGGRRGGSPHASTRPP